MFIQHNTDEHIIVNAKTVVHYVHESVDRKQAERAAIALSTNTADQCIPFSLSTFMRVKRAKKSCKN